MVTTLAAGPAPSSILDLSSGTIVAVTSARNAHGGGVLLRNPRLGAPPVLRI